MIQRSLTRRSWLVAALALGQLIGWGTTFDMLGALGRGIAADLHLASETAFAGISVMMIVGALLGPSVGRAIARFGAAHILAMGALLMGLGLMDLAHSFEAVSYLAGWVVIGAGAALGLSAGAHAAVVEREGAESKRAIGSLMLLTGLSSAIFWPVMSALAEGLGWRGALFVMGAVHIALCAPLYLWGLPPKHNNQSISTSQSADEPPIVLSPKGKMLAFTLIAAVTTILTFVGFGISASLLQMLRISGTSAAWALSLGSLRGVLGITARAADMVLGRRTTPVLTSIFACGLIIAAFLVLLMAGLGPLVLLGFVVLYGLGAGIASLARVLLPLSFFARSDYARQSGKLYLPQNLANAAAPVVYTAVLDRGGLLSVIVMTLGLTTLALVSAVLLARLEHQSRTAMG